MNATLALRESEPLAQPEDFAAIFTEYQPKIYRYVYRRTSDHYVAEDLTADVFVRAIDSVQRGIGYPETPLAWLYRIARNLVIDYYRARVYRRHLSIDDVEYLSDAQAQIAFDMDGFHDAISRLPDKHQHVLKLRYVDGLSQAEIGKKIGKSEDNVKGLLFRIHGALRQICSENPPPRKIANMAHDALRRYGPMTTTDLAKRIEKNPRSLANDLRDRPDVFVQLGVQYTGHHPNNVWGLKGVHTKEIAA
jgi:RNA polymerase sigma-70 factor (ECF subfamily)